MKMPSEQEALYRTMHNAVPDYRNNNQGLIRRRHWESSLKEKPASILEVGCGNGKLCKLLSDMGYDITGLDIVPGPYDREGYAFVKHDITLGYLPFEDNEFVHCLSFDVLEHLETSWIEHHIWDMLRVSTDGIIGTVACFRRARLHLTVKEPGYWKEIISRHSKVFEEEAQFHIFDEMKGKTLLFQTKKKE